MLTDIAARSLDSRAAARADGTDGADADADGGGGSLIGGNGHQRASSVTGLLAGGVRGGGTKPRAASATSTRGAPNGPAGAPEGGERPSRRPLASCLLLCSCCSYDVVVSKGRSLVVREGDGEVELTRAEPQPYPREEGEDGFV